MIDNRVNNLGANLHTALRKACDSKATSLLWNAVHVCPLAWKEALDRALTLEALNQDLNAERLKLAFDHDEWETLGFHQDQVEASRDMERRRKIPELHYQEWVITMISRQLSPAEWEVLVEWGRPPEEDDG